MTTMGPREQRALREGQPDWVVAMWRNADQWDLVMHNTMRTCRSTSDAFKRLAESFANHGTEPRDD